MKVIVSQELDVFSDPAEPSTTKGTWINTCTECTPEDVLVRDHIEDMEFIPIDENGRIIRDDAGRYPAPEIPGIRDRLYDIRGVDIRLTFRSKDFFFKNAAPTNKQRVITGLSERNLQSTDRYLRDSVIVSVATRNIGENHLTKKTNKRFCFSSIFSFTTCNVINGWRFSCYCFN